MVICWEKLSCYCCKCVDFAWYYCKLFALFCYYLNSQNNLIFIQFDWPKTNTCVCVSTLGNYFVIVHLLNIIQNVPHAALQQQLCYTYSCNMLIVNLHWFRFICQFEWCDEICVKIHLLLCGGLGVVIISPNRPAV